MPNESNDTVSPQHADWVRRTEAEVRGRLSGQAAGHAMDHIDRVVATALAIQSEESRGDRVTIELAALLHDVGDAKFHDGVERSGEFSREILTRIGVDPGVIEHVVHIVDNLSYRSRNTAQPLSLEGRIVQDADRIDALGAIGIVRTVEFGAARGQPFYLPASERCEPPVKTGLDHFDEKLFRLVDLMNTDAGRRVARGREAFMRSFVEQFRHEMRAGENVSGGRG